MESVKTDISEAMNNIKINENENEFNNFRKIMLTYGNTEFELAVSVYSNLIFIIITENSKIGNFWLGEMEYEDLEDPTENVYNTQCMLGNRKDETSYFLSNFIVQFVLGSIRKKDSYSKIQKVLVSSAIKYDNIFKTEEKSEIVASKEFKEFIGLIRNKLTELLNI